MTGLFNFIFLEVYWVITIIWETFQIAPEPKLVAWGLSLQIWAGGSLDIPLW